MATVNQLCAECVWRLATFVLLPAWDEFAPVRLRFEVVVEDVVAGGRRTPGLDQQRHVSLLRGAARLAVVALTTGAYQVFPGMTAATVAWQNVVDCEVVARLLAVLAGIPVAHKYFAAR